MLVFNSREANVRRALRGQCLQGRGAARIDRRHRHAGLLQQLQRTVQVEVRQGEGAVQRGSGRQVSRESTSGPRPVRP